MLKNNKEILRHIPLDKSWLIRMGALDILNKKEDIIKYLNSQNALGGDLKALKIIAKNWDSDRPLDVGESGTIYRFIRYALWKQGSNRKIITSGTLTKRAETRMCTNPEIVNWTPERLLTLDNNTSQWATMASLLGDRRKVKNPPFKLQVTYDAIDHWEEKRKQGKVWIARKDPTLENQALAFIRKLNGQDLNWIPEQAEDYCFAVAFNVLSIEEGAKEYSSILGHETKRDEEMKKQLEKYKEGEINSKDHRVVQALVMKSLVERRNLRVANPSVVNKTWPQFWEFINYCKANFN